MRKYSFILIFQLVGYVSVALSQTAMPSNVDFYRLPEGSYGVFIAYQPGSPLKFEGFEGFVDGRYKDPVVHFVICNTSSRDITFFEIGVYKSFTSGKWARYGVADGLAIGRENGRGSIVLPSKGVFQNFEMKGRVISDSKELLSDLYDRKVNFDRPVIIWFAKVNKVIFDDGTVFQDNRDLTNFFGFVDY